MTSLPPTQVNISLFGGEKMDPRATLKVIRANKFLCMNRKGTFYARVSTTQNRHNDLYSLKNMFG